MTDSSGSQNTGCWASPYQLVSGQTQQHQLGHVRFWVTLLDVEWQVRQMAYDPEAEAPDWLAHTGYSLPSSEVAVERFIRSPDDDGLVHYLPAMAGRPTVIRPYQPLTIPAGQRCVLYVGTTLWLKVCVGNEQNELTEFPLAPPSMTWLGRNTMEGELCFASATYGRLSLEAVPKRPWRAVTPVTIINRREEALLLERFSLPTPLLSLHRNQAGQLWTPGVTVECDTDMGSASLRIDAAVISDAGHCEPVAPAREKLVKGRLVRAFDHLFG
ncbi:hypothetical protein [Marinobacter oulmenensis]|uniref:DUF432 domain-containing protein n=1 Tax=Marinobacter oulmenensis TaxID=643747 RepID=A0A840UCA4_9GAMM|nr:hypothetical protein [Marinobacter oulmenensis]MBB5322739.1 hypothetical protein [Marinobacter oulmenensis]